MTLDWTRARWDVPYFCSEFLGVHPHAGQVKFLESYIKRDPGGWRAAYLNIYVSAGNRAGKTLAMALMVIHSCIFKIGMKPPGARESEMMTWLKAPFVHYHFGISQEVAGLVHHEMAMLLSGVHPAQQGRGCPLADEAQAPIAEWTTKDQGMWPQVTFASVLGGAQVRFRTTGERAISSLGQDMHMITFDEVGFEPNLRFIVNEVLDLRRLGTGGQLVLISTPTSGITDFADLWAEGDPESPKRKAGAAALRMSTRDNIGFGIDEQMFERIVGDMAPELIPQNIDGYFIQGAEAYFNAASVEAAFVDTLPEESPARNGAMYVQGVDPAIRNDDAWSLVFEVRYDKDGYAHAQGVRARQLAGRKTADSLIALAVDANRAYDHPGNVNSYCFTAMDAVGFGGKLFRQLVEEQIPSLRNIEFGGSPMAKRKLLGDLRTVLDSGRLRMPRSGPWDIVRRQLLGYKLADKKITQDAVMALAMAVSEAKRTPDTEAPTIRFDARFGDSPAPQDALSEWVRRPYEHMRRS